MALADSFAVNQKVILEVLEGAEQGRFPTRVEEVREGALVLAAPLVGRRVVQPAPGTPVRLQLDDASAGMKSIDTKVWESLPMTPSRRLPIIVLEQSDQVKQVQRRTDVRIDVTVPVRFAVLTSPDEGSDEQGLTMWPSLEAATVDISAGGSQMTTEVRLVPGTQIDVHLRLPDGGDSLQLVGEVMRVLHSEQRGSRTIHYLAIRWIGAEATDRDAIVAYVFREQVKRRRRGLL